MSVLFFFFFLCLFFYFFFFFFFQAEDGIRDVAVTGVQTCALPISPAGTFRLRWRAPNGGPALDLFAQRVAVDASPLLLANHVLRNEVLVRGEIPAGPLRLRGAGRAAGIEAGSERNTRTGFDAIAAV